MPIYLGGLQVLQGDADEYVDQATYDAAVAALQSDIDTRALNDSPVLAGTPTTPTPALNDNSLTIANTAWVTSMLSVITTGAPETLDTFLEVAQWIGNDETQTADILADLNTKATITYVDGQIAGLQTQLDDVDTELGDIQADLEALDVSKADKSLTINGYTLTASFSITQNDVGLANVDNTADADKPISTAQAEAFALRDDAIMLRQPIATITERLGFRNLFVNPDFDIWQRVTTYAATVAGGGGFPGPDRWRFRGPTLTGGTLNLSRGRGVGYATDSKFGSYLIYTRTGCTDIQYFAQRIYGLRKFSGQKITVSFMCQHDSAENMRVYVEGNFGNGGSPSATTSLVYPDDPVEAQNGLVTFVLDIPDLTGYTYGTDEDDYLEVYIRMEDLDDKTLRFGCLSCVFGDATGETNPYVKRTPAMELYECRAFYRIFRKTDSAYAPVAMGAANSSSTAICAIWLGQPMAFFPALSYSSVGDFDIECDDYPVTGISLVAESRMTDAHDIIILDISAADMVAYQATLLIIDQTGGWLALDAE